MQESIPALLIPKTIERRLAGLCQKLDDDCQPPIVERIAPTEQQNY
jgi:hypothetical protein